MNFLLLTQIPILKYLYTSKVPKSQINKCFWLSIRKRLEDGRKEGSNFLVMWYFPCVSEHIKKIAFSCKPTIILLQILRKIKLFTRKTRIFTSSHHFRANQTNSLTFYTTPPIDLPRQNPKKKQNKIPIRYPIHRLSWFFHFLIHRRNNKKPKYTKFPKDSNGEQLNFS